MIEIDLQGPQGNAFYLIGVARQLGKEVGMSEAEISAITTEMTAGDYKHLLTTLEDSFSDETFYFEGDPREPDAINPETGE